MSYQVTGKRRISLNGNLSPGGGGRTPLSVVAAFRYPWWPWAAVCSGSLPLSQCAECGGRIPLSVVAMGHCLWWPWAAVCGGRGPLSVVAVGRCLWGLHSVRGGRGPLSVVAVGRCMWWPWAAPAAPPAQTAALRESKVGVRRRGRAGRRRATAGRREREPVPAGPRDELESAGSGVGPGGGGEQGDCRRRRRISAYYSVVRASLQTRRY
jgi:hypothetical protein